MGFNLGVPAVHNYNESYYYRFCTWVVACGVGGGTVQVLNDQAKWEKTEQFQSKVALIGAIAAVWLAPLAVVAGIYTLRNRKFAAVAASVFASTFFFSVIHTYLVKCKPTVSLFGSLYESNTALEIRNRQLENEMDRRVKQQKIGKNEVAKGGDYLGFPVTATVPFLQKVLGKIEKLNGYRFSIFEEKFPEEKGELGEVLFLEGFSGPEAAVYNGTKLTYYLFDAVHVEKMRQLKLNLEARYNTEVPTEVVSVKIPTALASRGDVKRLALLIALQEERLGKAIDVIEDQIVEIANGWIDYIEEVRDACEERGLLDGVNEYVKEQIENFDLKDVEGLKKLLVTLDKAGLLEGAIKKLTTVKKTELDVALEKFAELGPVRQKLGVV